MLLHKNNIVLQIQTCLDSKQMNMKESTDYCGAFVCLFLQASLEKLGQRILNKVFSNLEYVWQPNGKDITWLDRQIQAL